MKRKVIISMLLVSIMYCIPFMLHAQPGPGQQDPDVPIDGGLSLLLAAGVGYTVKKMRDNKKKNNTTI